MRSVPTFGLLLFFCLTSFGQTTDSITLKVKAVKSDELLDLYRFEGINYFTMQLSGLGIEHQFFILTSTEYWNGTVTNVDTIANTKNYQLKNGSDTLEIRAMSKKINPDTVKFQFHLPRFSTSKTFPTTTKDTYSLRDITSNSEEIFDASKPINLLVYSLPYEDPEQPGYLFYCELSREGIAPEKWSEKFGVRHYVIFKFQLVK
ncbi:MAG: hypothetical protein AAF620_09180 [Bacteroidota bacterium]